jgi:hypothetical protein
MPDRDRPPEPDGLPEVELVPFRLFARDGDRILVLLPEVLRQNLSMLSASLRDALLQGDPEGLQRLFPPAYQDHDHHEAEYQRLMRDELLAARLQALDTLDSVLREDEVDEDGFAGLLRALNAIRVWLGTRLEIDDDDWEPPPDDPRLVEIEAYGAVGVLLELALRTTGEP